jgi:hypothetical protein
LRPAVRDPSIRSRCSLRQDDRKDACAGFRQGLQLAGLPVAFVMVFLCVIQSRCGEESQASFSRCDTHGILLSALSALNDTRIAVGWPQSAGRIVSMLTQPDRIQRAASQLAKAAILAENWPISRL